MHFFHKLLIINFLFLNVFAYEITLQNNDDYNGCIDAYIKSQRPDENCGDEDKLGCKFERCYA